MARPHAERYADWPAFLFCWVCRKDLLNKQATGSLTIHYRCYTCGLQVRVPGAQIDRRKIRKGFRLEAI